MRERRTLLLEILAIVGITVGVVMLFASQVESSSLNNSVRRLTKQIVGTTQFQIDSRGPDGFSDRLVNQVKRLPGVQAAMPVLEQQANVIGPKGQQSVVLFGADPRFAHTGSPLLRRFSTVQLAHQQAIALPAPIASAIGAGALQPVQLQIGASVKETLLGTTLQSADIGDLIDSPVALAPVAYAQELTGLQGRITRIYIRAQPGGEDRTRAALQKLAAAKHLNVEPADFDAQLFAVASAPANQGEELFSGISAIVGFMFAFNAMLLTVPERRLLIPQTRKRGATSGMVVQTLLLDALVIGALACALGLALGDAISASVFRSSAGYLSFAFPVGSQRVVTWQIYAIAVSAGMFAAVVGVMAPFRDILSPHQERQSDRSLSLPASRQMRVAGGLLCLAITTGILIWRPQSAVLGSFTLIMALFALLPFLFDLIVAAFNILQAPLNRAAPRIAIIELKDPQTRVRSLAVAATCALAVFSIVAILGARSNLQDGLDLTAVEMNHVTDLWVSPSGGDNTLGTTPFPISVENKLTKLQDVKSVNVYRGGFLDVANRRAWVIAPPRTSPRPIPSGQLIQGNLASTTARVRSGGWAVLSEAIAHDLHLHMGQPFNLPSPEPTKLRVAALIANAGWPPGAIIMNAVDYAHAWNTDAASAFNIILTHGVSLNQGRLEVMRALGGPNSGLAVQTAAQREQEWKTVSHQGLSRLALIGKFILIAAALAIAGVMSSMIWQRRGQIAYMKRQGYTRNSMWCALLCESSLILIAGCLIGATFGLYGQILVSHALATVTGFPTIIRLGFVIAVSSVSFVSASALIIVALPGYLAACVRPTTASPT